VYPRAGCPAGTEGEASGGFHWRNEKRAATPWLDMPAPVWSNVPAGQENLAGGQRIPTRSPRKNPPTQTPGAPIRLKERRTPIRPKERRTPIRLKERRTPIRPALREPMVRGIRLSLSSQGRAIRRSPLLGRTSAPIGGIQIIDMRHHNFPVGLLRQKPVMDAGGARE